MHKYHFPLFGRGLLLAAATLVPLGAQESGFSTDLKLRTGYSLATKDNLRNSPIGFGLTFGFATSIGKLGAELGYRYQGGDSYMQPVNGSEVPSGLQSLDETMSGDQRKNTLDGFAVRLSLTNPINADWDWQGGLMLGGTRFKHQYVGDVRSQNWDADHANAWRDTYSGTPVSNGLKVSPYAGVIWKLDKDSAFEFNLMIVNYQALDHVHHPGAAAHGYPMANDSSGNPVAPLSAHNDFPDDSEVKTNRLVPQIEIGYVFHF